MVRGRIELGSMGWGMRNKLHKEFAPTKALLVSDESHLHRGHAGVEGAKNPETHFNVFCVSDTFAGKSLVARHRLVNTLFKDEFDQGLHALSMSLHTGEEADKKGEKLQLDFQDAEQQDGIAP